MSQEHNEPAEQIEQSAPTPLELVKQQQAMQSESKDVGEHRPDNSPEVPGASSPSNRRKHPQRQMYGGRD